MRKRKYSFLFKRAIGKLKGKELQNVLRKMNEILNCKNLTHYKNLRYDLKKYKRVHINDSYIILFFGYNDIVYFIDYEHHNKVYKKRYNEFDF